MPVRYHGAVKNMMRTLRGGGRAVVLALAICLAGSGSGAEERSVTVVGVGAVISSGSYLGEHIRVIPVPFVLAQRGRWFFEGVRGGYRLHDGEAVRADILLAPRFGPFDADDDPALAGMVDRRTTLEGGMAVRIRPIEDKPLSFRLEAFHDLLGEHDGTALGATVAWEIDRGWWALTPRAGVTWHDRRLMRHLAGVSAAEARAGRAAYEPGAEESYEVGLSARVPLSRTWGLSVIGGWEHFGDRFSRSPVVERAGSWTAIIGVGRVL